MDWNMANFLKNLMVLFLISTTPVFAQSSTQSESVNQFQEWLKNNNSAALPASASPPPPFINQSQSAKPPKQVSVEDLEDIIPAPIGYEEGQKIMLNSVPPAKAPAPDSTLAFNSMLKQNMPLAPQQVVQLRQQIDLAQRASAIPANIPPKPVSTTLMINLAPGATPPAIRLAQGYVSSLDRK